MGAPTTTSTTQIALAASPNMNSTAPNPKTTITELAALVLKNEVRIKIEKIKNVVHVLIVLL